MLKILNTTQIKEWDAFTIRHEPISSIDLMERACRAFVQWFTLKFDASHTIGVVCGAGNNGGDGLGIARMLSDWGYPVKVWIVTGTVLESVDFKVNKERLPERVDVKEFSTIPSSELFESCQVLIDGLFGSGLSREPEGIYADVISLMNSSELTIVAIDIPSGLFADQHTSGVCVHADYTITFQFAKLAFLLPENENRVGEWMAVDIGLSKAYLKDALVSNFLLNQKYVASLLPKRKKFSHKGDFGHALLIAGSYGKMGAAVLAARAAMRSGLGLLTVHVPKEGYSIIQNSVPEAMTSIDTNQFCFSGTGELDSFDVIGVGPGLGVESTTVNAIKSLLEKASRPLVIDADALNILAENSSLLHLLPPQSILTPHPGEFRRLVGDWNNDFDRLNKTRDFAKSTRCIVILKGAYSAVVSPDGLVYFNNSGNPGMATGGSGDVLTGVLTGLLAQRLNAIDAALIGTYIHGLAGDIAAAENGQTALIASDIISALPDAFKQIYR